MEIEEKTDNDGDIGDKCKNSNEGEGVVTLVDSSDELDGSNVDKEPSNMILFNEEQGDVVDLFGSLVGLKRWKIEDIYDLYCDHAREVGFTVRKTTTRCNHAGVVIEKYYVCSCQGSKRSTSSSTSNQVQRKEKKRCITRTGCQAYLRVKMNSKGVYEVIGHNTQHNHTLHRKVWRHMHHPERVISSKNVIYDSSCYVSQDVKEENCSGEDHLNIVKQLNMSGIEGRDAQRLLDALCQQNAEDKDFFFRVKLDDFGRLCNVFWRDSLMKEDYRMYGDVVVFDTTCRNTNNLLCAPFIGVNNHRKNVMFGCAFIADEKVQSFEWLLEVFKESMEGQCPVMMFTNEDVVIGNAVEKVFPGIRHRLCWWHLYHDAVSQSGNLKGDKCFDDAFNKCLSGCTNESEFESCWNSMVSKNLLNDHSWFKRLHDLREKWSTAFGNDFFSSGNLPYCAIGYIAKKITSLHEFHTIFKKTVKRLRSNEAKDEHQCSTVTHTSVVPLTGILKHASEVYTLSVFKDFEEEFLKSLATSCKMLRDDSGTIFYNVVRDDGVICGDVTFTVADNTISCSCKRFEECGLLCRHCLKVFYMHSLTRIPDIYIKRRWTKFARKDLWDSLGIGIEMLDEKVNGCNLWRHDIMRKYYNLLLKAQGNNEVRKTMEDGLDRLSGAVDALMNARHWTKENDASSSSVDIVDTMCPSSKKRKNGDSSNTHLFGLGNLY
ncbi:Protein FAR1-RELATED SEQUENCE 5 [Striga hermonthica]|uniref:Protein FAR1-RELATED SEQUENCE 5 n=1 Tax=Striga hermonthica TaxID=68872 RepID=A0A9N7NCF8_STRHE|nr:Protein FAR1-RELATED SEQUENCE 5 [Striga hermonthica]